MKGSDGNNIWLAGSTTFLVNDALTEGASLYVSAANAPRDITFRYHANNTELPGTFFHSDDFEYSVVEINGGTVNARSRKGGAGIGSGGCDDPDNIIPSGGTVNISGGTLTANGSDSGASIGSSFYAGGFDVNITGGNMDLEPDGKTTYVGIELRTHVLTREVAGGSQFTCNHTSMFTERRKDDILDGSFLRGSIFAPPPVAEVGPPLTANKACLASEELTVDTASLAHHSTLPLPQRPFPRAIGKPRETALISHKRFGIIAIDATIQQRQKSHHVHTLHQLRTGMNASLHASAEDKLSVLGTAVEDVACFVFHFRCSV